MTAMPCPPPMHAEPIARLRPRRLQKTQYLIIYLLHTRESGTGGAQRVAEGGGRRCRPRGYLSSCTRCAVMREPEAPSGWPRAAVPATWLPELVHEVRRDAGAGGAQRVAEGGGAGHVTT
ncbi:hypothetical protein ACJJTC_010707 [Scirpophaga incertulas]